jgi:mono/diheme cytochrome c family protein
MSINEKTSRPGWGCSLGLIVLLIGVSAALVLLTPRALALLANQPTTAATALVDRTSPEQVAAYRAAADAQLNSYGWVDQTAHLARIPIDRAMALVAAQGLPVGAPAAVEQPATEAAPQNQPTAPDPTQVDFQRDVLPIFEQHCTECHGFEEPEEGLVLTGYRSVMQGSNNGPVIESGDPDKSYLVEMIVEGKMPKRGKKLTPEEIATIIAWVQGGALEQAASESTGPDSTLVATVTVTATTVTVAKPTATVTVTAKALTTAKPTATAMVKTTPTARAAATLPPTTIAIATVVTTPIATAAISAAPVAAAAAPTVDPAQVSFKNDVLPLFERSCTECHGFEEPEEGLVLTGYRSIMQGSNNGPVIEPGNPDKSYLVEMIVEGKMPKRGKKLTPEEIALIIAWVKGGARND